MKLVSHNDSSLDDAIHINEILKAGIFAIDEAVRKYQKTIIYDGNLFDGVNPDHVIPFSDDQAILYDFKNHLVADVGISLFYSLAVEFAVLLSEENNERQWNELKNIVVRLMNQPIYFFVKNEA